MIPKIDLTPLWEDFDTGIKVVASDIQTAYKKYGFAYIINHNIPINITNDVYEAAKSFHNLPLHEKMKIKQNDCFRGYVPLNASKFKVSTQGKAKKPNQHDAFVMAFEPDKKSTDYHEGLYLCGDNQFPESLPLFKSQLFAYRDAVLKLSNILVQVFSVALGMDKNYLDKYFINPTYFLRLQHYPEQAPNIPDDVFGIAPHTDYGFFNLLSQQNVEGLEVLDQETNQWLPIPYVENSFVLNTGDMFKRLSNDHYKSTPHRVVNRSGRERFSIPFFFEPNMRADIEVLQNHIDGASPSKYPNIMYGDYLMERIQGNYGLGKKQS